MTPRERALAATVECAGQLGIAALTMDEIARRSGVSRASLYRLFPGGRDELLSAATTWEVGRFFRALAEDLADEAELAGRLERGLVLARQRLEEHDVLQRLLASDQEQFLPHLFATEPVVLGVLRSYFEPLLVDRSLADGQDPESAADYLARMVFSFIGSPGRWDLADPVAVHRLVRTQFLAPVLR